MPIPKLALIPLAAAALLFCASLPGFSPAASAADSAPSIRFADNHFTPRTVAVPAGKPLKLKVVNASAETIEFESFKLNREKAMTPGETIVVRLPALSPGHYDFYDDFHQNVPQGTIVAK